LATVNFWLVAPEIFTPFFNQDSFIGTAPMFPPKKVTEPFRNWFGFPAETELPGLNNHQRQTTESLDGLMSRSVPETAKRVLTPSANFATIEYRRHD